MILNEKLFILHNFCPIILEKNIPLQKISKYQFRRD